MNKTAAEELVHDALAKVSELGTVGAMRWLLHQALFPVPSPDPDAATQQMRLYFERLYMEAHGSDARTLMRNEDGSYYHIKVQADWGFYQRAWADAVHEAAEDTVRLDWMLSRDAIRVQGNDKRGWAIMDCNDGLTMPVRGAVTARIAIDMAKKMGL